MAGGRIRALPRSAGGPPARSGRAGKLVVRIFPPVLCFPPAATGDRSRSVGGGVRMRPWRVGFFRCEYSRFLIICAMLNYIWLGLVVCAVLIGGWNGQLKEVS